MTTKNFKQRFLSLLLAVITLITMFPVNAAYAATNEEISGGYCIAWESFTVYDDEALTKPKGTIFKGEGFTVIGQYAPGGVIKVNYSIPKNPGYNEGYVSVMDRFGPDEYYNFPGCAAVVKQTSKVYYGANPDYYVQAGTVYETEVISVLAKEGEWVYIEYNAAGGTRKRGYMLYDNLTIYSRPIRFDDFPTQGYHQEYISGRRNIYAGPTTQYPIVGYVENENVTIGITEIVYYKNYTDTTYYLEYMVGNKKKSGYLVWDQ